MKPRQSTDQIKAKLDALKHEHDHGQKRLGRGEIRWLLDTVRELVTPKQMVEIEEQGPGQVPVAAIAIEGYGVQQWCPTPDPKDSKPEQVWLTFDVPAIKYPMIMRFKTLRSVKLLAGTLLHHAQEVWPDSQD